MSACLPLLLTACAASTEAVAPRLPDPPPALVACTQAALPPIPGAPGSGLSKAQAAETLGEQRAAALSKHRCARGWMTYYRDLGRSLGAAG